MSGQDDISGIKEDLKKCATSNSDLNDCLLNLATRVKPYIKTGIPELNIPQADPLIIDRLEQI